MKRKLLLLSFVTSLVSSVFAQEMPTEKATFSVAPNAQSVKFAVRMSNTGDVLVCNFGEGEGIKTFTNVSDETLTSLEYTFNTPSSQERTIEIAANKITTLRVVNTKSINGIVDINSSLLENLNIDYVSLTAHNKVDVSKCPALVSLTLTSTGVEEVVLPKSELFESVQVSPNALGEGTLKKINLQDVPNLNEIGFVGASIDTLDLRNNPKMKVLVSSLPKKALRAIKGVKQLRGITTLDVRANALAFDQLPDLYVEDLELENFRYSSQGSILIPKNKINGFTVDLNHLTTAKGLAPAKQTTTFTWKYKANATAKYAEVPSDKMTNVDGVFTFDKTLSEDDTLRVYCTMSNPGYPGIGKKNSDNISTYMIKLTATTNGLNEVAATNNHNDIAIIFRENDVYIESAVQQRATLYNLVGQKMWDGFLPANVPLHNGTYILQSEKSGTRKFTK